MVCKLIMTFIFLNGWDKNPKKIISHDMWKLYAIQTLVSTNKVLLKHSCAHLFIYYLGLLLPYDPTFCKAQSICDLALYRKSWSTSALLQSLPNNPNGSPFKSKILNVLLIYCPQLEYKFQETFSLVATTWNMVKSSINIWVNEWQR